jgi:hypothetical protein
VKPIGTFDPVSRSSDQTSRFLKRTILFIQMLNKHSEASDEVKFSQVKLSQVHRAEMSGSAIIPFQNGS